MSIFLNLCDFEGILYAIFNYFNKEKEEVVLKISETQGSVLRYGENPHQKGYFFGDFEAMFTKLHGKELSYNNLLDVDAAVNLMNEFYRQELHSS